MAICKAILKYGRNNFRLEILEYCNLDILLEREQYYIDLLKPEYNLLTTAGSSLGYRHTEETLAKFKAREFSAETRLNLSKAATGRILTEETKKKLSSIKKGNKLSIETRAKLSKIAILREGVSVEIKNIVTGETKQYASLTLAGLEIGVSRTAIKKALEKNGIIKDTYSVKLINK